MKTALLVALALLSATRPSLRAGVAVNQAGDAILAIAGPALPAGSSVTLLATGTPQQVYRATIVRGLAESPLMARHLVEGPYYQIAASDGRALPALAVAVPGRPAVNRQASGVSLRIDAENPDVRVRSCASHEGLHLTTWAGEPLKSPRLWHQYFYLGYDVEPDCRAAEIDEKGAR